MQQPGLVPVAELVGGHDVRRAEFDFRPGPDDGTIDDDRGSDERTARRRL